MNDRIQDALKALREADCNLHAPQYLETRLRAAFRDQLGRNRHAPFTRWWAVAATCAAALVALVIWDFAGAPEVAPPAPPEIAYAVPAVPQPKPAVAAAAPKRAVPRTREPLEFTALPYAPPLMPYEQGQVIRVRLPRQSLRDLGVVLRADRPMERIPAEILMGEDGVARGIRFVSYR